MISILYSIVFLTGLIANNNELTTFQSLIIGVIGVGITAILYALDLIRDDIKR